MKKALLCQAVAILFAAGAQATPILPGQLIVALGEPDPSGGTVVATLTAPFSPGALSGWLDSSVIVGDVNNPLGGLTFTYKLSNDGASAENIVYFRVGGFDSFGTDVSHSPVFLNVPPFSIDRSADGTVLGFLFLPLPPTSFLAPGAQSELLVVQTDATAYQPVEAFVIGSASSVASVLGLAPAGAKTTIPDAGSTLPLLGTSLLAVGLLARRHGKRPGFAEA
ncbi:MAG: hypothetical protein AB9869_05110 [Verrucomicrobiia bacterium]